MRTTALALIEGSGLAPEDFDDPTEPRLKTAWKIAESLARRRRPVSAASVYAMGAAHRMFDPKDEQWLRQLATSNELDPTTFADVVQHHRDHLQRRGLVETLSRYVVQLREKNADIATAAHELEQYIQRLQVYSSRDHDASEDVLSVSDDWDREEAGEVATVIPSCIKTLDDEITGFRSTLNIIMSLPGVGKTALLASIMDAQLDRFADVPGFKLGLFGLEDGTRWFFERLIARDLGWAIGDIGLRRRDRETAEKYQVLAARHHNRLKRVITYPFEECTTREMTRRGREWTRKGVRCIYVDNGSEVDHYGGSTLNGEQQRELNHTQIVGSTYRQIRRTAIDTQTPWVVLVHSNRDADAEERPPRATEISESSFIEKRARLILGAWEKASEKDEWMRITVLKNTKGRKLTTLRLARLTTASLIDREIGDTVNLAKERNDAYKAAKAKKEEEQAAKKKRMAEERERAKEARKHGGAPQFSFTTNQPEPEGEE